MHSLLVHPAYFGSVCQYTAMLKAEVLIFENKDHYQKQTYRNRMYIYGANGKLLLNIPIKHTGNKSNHQNYREVRIENDFPWQQQHWRSLETVYRTSPFFEFYEDELLPLYSQKCDFLLDFNYRCLEFAADCLQWDLTYDKTSEYMANPLEIVDGRFLIEAKKEEIKHLQAYPQVFSEKFGFLANLSVLDLIFNEGPNAASYLEQQQLPDRLSAALP